MKDLVKIGFNLCIIIIGFIVIVVFLIPKGKEFAVEKLRTDERVRDVVSSAVQSMKTAGKDVRAAYEDYLATMRSVSALTGESGRIMSFEEFKDQWDKQGESTIDRWIQEYDLAKLFKKIKNKRAFYCWCLAKGYINLVEFHTYMNWPSNWHPDKLAQYVPEYLKNPIPEKGKRVKFYQCLEGRDQYRTK